jgi:hypothetical protein
MEDFSSTLVVFFNCLNKFNLPKKHLTCTFSQLTNIFVGIYYIRPLWMGGRVRRIPAPFGRVYENFQTKKKEFWVEDLFQTKDW